MFDNRVPGQMQGPVHVAALSHVARQARWSLNAKRSYLVPSLLWVTAGQGRILVDEEMRGFTAHNAIFLPANTPHAIDLAPRSQGMALFLNASTDLDCPETVLHLRLHDLGRQSMVTRMIDEIAQEVVSNACDAEAVLHHQTALLLLLLRRNCLEEKQGSDGEPASDSDETKPEQAEPAAGPARKSAESVGRS